MSNIVRRFKGGTIPKQFSTEFKVVNVYPGPTAKEIMNMNKEFQETMKQIDQEEIESQIAMKNIYAGNSENFCYTKKLR